MSKITMGLMDKKKCMVKDLAHRDFLDLAIVYRKDGLVIFNEDLNIMQISENDLYDQAYQNCQKDFLIGSVREVFKRKKFLPPTSESDFLIVSNQQINQGASVILCQECRKELAKKMNGDCYLIPSSIHEWLALPIYYDPVMLKKIIWNVNDTLMHSDILSDHPYYYNAYLDAISIV